MAMPLGNKMQHGNVLYGASQNQNWDAKWREVQIMDRGYRIVTKRGQNWGHLLIQDWMIAERCSNFKFKPSASFPGLWGRKKWRHKTRNAFQP